MRIQRFSYFFFSLVFLISGNSVWSQPVSESNPPATPISPSTPSTPAMPNLAPPPIPPAPPAKLEPQCKAQFRAAFSQLEVMEWGGLEQRRTFSELGVSQTISSLFRSIPERCETGAYGEFINQFSEFARSAIRETNVRKAKLTAAILMLKYRPMYVPFEESVSSKSQLSTLKSHMDALRDDLKLYPSSGSKKKNPVDGSIVSLQTRLFNEINALSPPLVDAPAPTPTPSDSNTISIKLPTVPMPAWAVGTLFQVRDILRNSTPSLAEVKEAQTKLQFVIDWINAPVYNAPVPTNLGSVSPVKAPTTPLPNWAIETLYDLWLNPLQQEVRKRELINQSGPLERMSALVEATGKLETLCKWLETSP